jgi:hypothetical protein
MAEKDPKSITPSSGGLFQDVSMRIKLILRLMGDPRVSPLVKMLPVGALVYLVFPFDIPTPIDDALIVWLGTTLFVEMCPPEVVDEHMKALKNSVQGEWKESSPGAGSPKQDEDIVDAEYWEEKK